MANILNSKAGASWDTFAEHRMLTQGVSSGTSDTSQHGNLAVEWENLSGQLSERSQGALSTPAQPAVSV